MIVEWLIGLGAIVSDWFASLFPTDWEIPPFLAGLDETVNDILANLSGVGVWADWVYIIGVVGVVLALWATALLIKVARAVAAHVPFFGGAG